MVVACIPAFGVRSWVKRDQKESESLQLSQTLQLAAVWNKVFQKMTFPSFSKQLLPWASPEPGFRCSARALQPPWAALTLWHRCCHLPCAIPAVSPLLCHPCSVTSSVPSCRKNWMRFWSSAEEWALECSNEINANHKAVDTGLTAQTPQTGNSPVSREGWTLWSVI